MRIKIHKRPNHMNQLTQQLIQIVLSSTPSLPPPKKYSYQTQIKRMKPQAIKARKSADSLKKFLEKLVIENGVT